MSFNLRRLIACEVVENDLNLRHNTGLRSLTLYNPNTPEYLDILSQVISTELRTISLVLQFTSLSGLKNKDYKALDERLVHPDLRNLEEVHILYEGSLAHDEVTRKLRRVFPSVSARGILRVEMC